jgi:hypothetical protein
MQNDRDTSPKTAAEAMQSIWETASKLYATIYDGSISYGELWLDYISVPQWSEEIKAISWQATRPERAQRAMANSVCLASGNAQEV